MPFAITRAALGERIQIPTSDDEARAIEEAVRGISGALDIEEKFDIVLANFGVQLAATPDGDRLVKEFRKTLLKTWEPELEGLVDQTLGARATRIYSDLDTTGGEMVLVIVLDRKIAGTVQG